MLRHALEAQGHTVVEARDQPEAAAALQPVRPAMVLSDLRLPKATGSASCAPPKSSIRSCPWS